MFLTLFLLPVALLEWRLRTHPTVDSYAFKKHLVESTLETNEVIILGSSLSWTGLNPNLISDRCVNLANFNQAFYHDLKIMEKYLPQSKNLKAVVLPLSSPSFYALPSERADQLYDLYWNFPPHSGKRDLENYSAIMAFGLWEGLKLIPGDTGIANGRGWGAFDITYDGNEADALARIGLLEKEFKEENFAVCSGYFRQIVGLCAKHKVRLILFLPPYSTTVNKFLEPKAYEQKMMEYIRQSCATLPVECYNLNDNTVFTTDCFRDPDHLNVKGSRLLSAQMKEIIERPSEKWRF